MNPVTYEVIRNRLLAITDEMRIALQSVSGSPTVTEATDFFTGLYLPDGDFATMGFQVTHEAPPVGALIRHINKTGRDINDGDMFIGNDPYVGALHQNDLQMAAPIYAGGTGDAAGRVIAWAGVMAHETDMGGMNFASWCPQATEVYQEGLRIPAVKLVDRGTVREDVLEMILTATRLPAALGLDIRAFIATLNVARDRLRGLFAAYGADQIAAVMRQMIAVTEREARDRLARLPDGAMHVRDFLEHDGHANRLYTVDLVATKRGDTLTLDFSGSSPQAPGFINATRAGLAGGVTGALIPVLGFGIPWNAGLLRPVTIAAPEGLICTARHPAPVGSATVETIWTVTNTVQRALNMFLACTPEFADRAQAVSSGTMSTFNLGGVNQYGERFGLHLLDPLAGGSGAFATRDGASAGGPVAVPMPAIADVEFTELTSPLFYRYRRLRPGTGGAGTHRGGHAAEIGLAIRGTGTAQALVMTHGAEVPNSAGLFGGHPGATVSQRLNGERLGPKPGTIPMTPADLFEVSWQGGGGFGDPLDRDPAAVAAEVAAGLITAAQARSVYGVLMAERSVDLPATTTLRARVRTARTARTASPSGPMAPSARSGGSDGAIGPRELGPSLRLEWRDGVAEVRTVGGAVLCRGSTRWRAGAVARRVEPESFGITLHEELAMTAFYCPVSGTQLAVDVHRRDEPPFDDLDLEVAAQ